ncbi:MAG: hypothetical protein LCI00_10320 [Chloroflexi bacterium]|nr:hypothetical protein [Chloroflexota bacterium]MCC6894849.1 hypothetical protein [Anaerolineae bacterium]
MRSHVQRKRLIRVGIVALLLVFFSVQMGFTQAADTFISIAFDQSVATIGRTPKLTINISNLGTTTVRVNRIQCFQTGTSLAASSIQGYPSTVAPNQGFNTTQLYRAASPGLTEVRCDLTATDLSTGQPFTVSSIPTSVNVLSETRLYFDAVSATRVATVGQTVFVQAKFGNRGKTPFTNLNLSCVELGRSLVFISSTPLQSTILPGQSGFVEYRWQAVRPGSAPIACSLTATDSVNGQPVTLPAPTINIEVR